MYLRSSYNSKRRVAAAVMGFESRLRPKAQNTGSGAPAQLRSQRATANTSKCAVLSLISFGIEDLADEAPGGPPTLLYANTAAVNAYYGRNQKDLALTDDDTVIPSRASAQATLMTHTMSAI